MNKLGNKYNKQLIKINFYMQINKTKKDMTLSQSLKIEQRKSLKYRFDTNPKNYQCFINKNSSKQDKKKLLKNKSNSIASNKGVQQKNLQDVNKQTEKKKNEQSKEQPQQIIKNSKPKIKQNRKKQFSTSPDLLKVSMNQIICKIEKEGIKSEWNQDQCKKSQDQSQVFLPNQQKIWLNTQKLSVIQQVQKSFISTQQTVLSETSRRYFNHSYIEYPNFMIPVHPHFSFNSSFSYTQEVYPTQYYNMIEKNSINAKKLFEINFDMIQSDGRTTVMIKNIPNKYSLKLLAEQIDQKHADQYDFLYLPFDFNNNCNVGYAFINFLSPEYLKEFHKSFNHKKWSKFRSEKICVLTYARLQGRNILIDHFYNSKVLNQKQKRYRPIIKEMSKISDLLEKQRKRTQQK